jgi:hypothetical protein
VVVGFRFRFRFRRVFVFLLLCLGFRHVFLLLCASFTFFFSLDLVILELGGWWSGVANMGGGYSVCSDLMW